MPETSNSRIAWGRAKYCAACRIARRRAPASRLTPAQGAEIERRRDTMTRAAIAQCLGISQAQVSRYLREQGLRSNVRATPPALVVAVCAVYAAAPAGQGKAQVEALFPDVKVRSIVERHRDFPPRQARWTAPQRIEAARMAGLVSHTAQARYFGRPHAHGGSIAKLWARDFQCAPRDVHGLGAHLAWALALPGVVATLVQHQEASGARPIILWLDLLPALRPEVEPIMRQVVTTLARFQAWIHGTTDTAIIRQMIRAREGG